MSYLPLTAQQVFNNALFGIRAQNYASSFSDSRNTCMYRGAESRKCGIGFSLPDELASEKIEGSNIGVLLGSSEFEVEFASIRELFAGVDPYFLAAIQTAHDRELSYDDITSRKEKFERTMKRLAEFYKLSYSAI